MPLIYFLRFVGLTRAVRWRRNFTYRYSVPTAPCFNARGQESTRNLCCRKPARLGMSL